VTRTQGTRRLAATLASLAVAGTLAEGLPALADEGHGVDGFAGYSYAELGNASRHGGSLALAFDLAGPASVFVDLSAHRGSQGGLDRDDLTLMAGPGVRIGRRGGTVFFARALAGLVRDASSVSVLDVSISEASTRFGVMGGAGVDLRLAPRWAARAQGDYLWHEAAGGGKRSGFRVAAGVVYRFGAAP
jgi:hypothetical protein